MFQDYKDEILCGLSCGVTCVGGCGLSCAGACALDGPVPISDTAGLSYGTASATVPSTMGLYELWH
jgi:hypothetical protein